MSQAFSQFGSGEALNLQELAARGVNAAWIAKLNEIHNAGILGFSYGIVKTARPLQTFTKFTILAFFFNWIYYLVKGMRKKGLVLLGAALAIGLFSGLVSSLISAFLGGILSFAAAAGLMIYAAMAASGDYYRYVVLKEDFWV